MEALHFGEGNDHPHKPPTLAVHTDAREDGREVVE